VGGEGSGGWNRKTPAQHRAAGTYRADRDTRPAATLPAEFQADARAMVRRLLAFADRSLKQAEKARGKGAMKSAGAALKCLTAALSIARGLGGDGTAPPPNRLEQHLAKRAKVVPMTGKFAGRDRGRDPEHDAITRRN